MIMPGIPKIPPPPRDGDNDQKTESPVESPKNFWSKNIAVKTENKNKNCKINSLQRIHQ